MIKDAPEHTAADVPVLLALPETNVMVAASSISIIPVAVATAQPVAGA